MTPSRRTIDAATALSGTRPTLAEQRAKQGFLTEDEWRRRVVAAVRHAFRSDVWTWSDRDEATAEVWSRGAERLIGAESIGAKIERAVRRAYGLPASAEQMSATPHRDDPAHSLTAYYGLAGNVLDKLQRERRRVKAMPVGGGADGALSALDVLPDERGEPLRVLIGGAALRPTAKQHSAAELLGHTLAGARAERDASVERLRLPVPHVAYLAARGKQLKPQQVRDELDLSDDTWRKRLARERALVGAQCDDGAADLVRYLCGVSPRAGHITDAGRWHAATLKLRPPGGSGRRKRVATATLLYCREDNSRVSYPRRAGTTDAAAERHGRSMADAADAARRRALTDAPAAPVAWRSAEPDPLRSTPSEVERLAAIMRRGRRKRSDAEALAEHAAANATRPRVAPDTSGARAVSSDGAAERGATLRDTLAPRTPLQWAPHSTDLASRDWPSAERTARLAALLTANTARRTAERVRTIVAGTAPSDSERAAQHAARTIDAARARRREARRLELLVASGASIDSTDDETRARRRAILDATRVAGMETAAILRGAHDAGAVWLATDQQGSYDTAA